MKSNIRWWAGGVLVAAVVAAGIWWSQAGLARDAVVAALPVRPESESDGSILAEHLAEADTAARSRFGAVEGLGRLARLYHANGYLDQAILCYRELEQLQPDEPRWPHLHATILAGYGEIETARALWERVLELAPDYIPARLRLGDCQLKANQFAEAAQTYGDVLKREPGNGYAELGLARIDFEAGRLEAARVRLEKIVRETKFQLGYDLIVSVYERTGERERATAIRSAQKAFGSYRDPADPWVDELIDECFDSYRLSLTAGVLAGTGQAPRAVELLQRAVAYAPSDVSAQFQLGVVLAETGSVAGAKQQFERCTTLAPEFADGWARLSDLLRRQGNGAEAERVLMRGLSHCPESPGLHLMHARNLQSAGRIEDAMVAYQTSIYYRPNEPDAYLELGKMLIAADRTEEGMAQVRAALTAEPGNPMALGILAYHAIVTGDRAAADAWLTQIGFQPRVLPDQLQRLASAYAQQFGAAWKPAR